MFDLEKSMLQSRTPEAPKNVTSLICFRDPHSWLEDGFFSMIPGHHVIRKRRFPRFCRVCVDRWN